MLKKEKKVKTQHKNVKTQHKKTEYKLQEQGTGYFNKHILIWCKKTILNIILINFEKNHSLSSWVLI